jgi:hypothetical protein
MKKISIAIGIMIVLACLAGIWIRSDKTTDVLGALCLAINDLGITCAIKPEPQASTPPAIEAQLEADIRALYQKQGWSVTEVQMLRMENSGKLEGFAKLRKAFIKEGNRLVPLSQDLELTVSCSADKAADGTYLWRCSPFR